MDEKEEEWSKERIQAEMDDLKSSGRTRLAITMILMISGISALITPLMVIALSSPYYTPPMGAILSIFGPFIAGGIVLIVIGIFPLRSYLQKRRRYNELKTRL